VNSAARDADLLLTAKNANVESVRKGLTPIKEKYKLNTIDLVLENDGEYHVTAKINPEASTPSRRLKKKEHTEFYPEKMDVKAVSDGVVITYTTRAGKNFETKVGRSGHVTEAKGFDLDLTTLGRGITEDPANKEKNKGQNSAHIIANWFGGSGYKKSLNLVTTSAHFNQVVMGRAEDQIVDWVKHIQIQKFNLKVAVDWGVVKEEEAVKRVQERVKDLAGLSGDELEKSRTKIIRDLAGFKAELKAVEDVEYSASGFDLSQKPQKMRPINTGADTWLK
jgi:hypothetical protein